MPALAGIASTVPMVTKSGLLSAMARQIHTMYAPSSAQSITTPGICEEDGKWNGCTRVQCMTPKGSHSTSVFHTPIHATKTADSTALRKGPPPDPAAAASSCRLAPGPSAVSPSTLAIASESGGTMPNADEMPSLTNKLSDCGCCGDGGKSHDSACTWPPAPSILSSTS